MRWEIELLNGKTGFFLLFKAGRIAALDEIAARFTKAEVSVYFNMLRQSSCISFSLSLSLFFFSCGCYDA